MNVREKVWFGTLVKALESNTQPSAVSCADGALAEFDKRFPRSSESDIVGGGSVIVWKREEIDAVSAFRKSHPSVSSDRQAVTRMLLGA